MYPSAGTVPLPPLPCQLVSLEWSYYRPSLDDVRAILDASRSTIRNLSLGNVSLCSNDLPPRPAFVEFLAQLPLTSLRLGENKIGDGVDPLYLDSLPARLPLLRHLNFMEGKGFSNALFDTLPSTNPLVRTLSLHFSGTNWPAALPSLLTFIRTRGGAGNLEILKFTSAWNELDEEPCGPKPEDDEIDQIVRAAGEAGVGIELPRWVMSPEWVKIVDERDGVVEEEEEDEEGEKGGEGLLMQLSKLRQSAMGQYRTWKIALQEVEDFDQDYW